MGGKPSCCRGPSECNQCARTSDSTEPRADAQPALEWSSVPIQQPRDWAAAGNLSDLGVGAGACCTGPGACKECYPGKPMCCRGPSECNQCARPSDSTEPRADAKPASEWNSVPIQQPRDWAAAGNWKEPYESTDFTQDATIPSGFFVCFFLASLVGLAVTMCVIRMSGKDPINPKPLLG